MQSLLILVSAIVLAAAQYPASTGSNRANAVVADSELNQIISQILSQAKSIQPQFTSIQPQLQNTATNNIKSYQSLQNQQPPGQYGEPQRLQSIQNEYRTSKDTNQQQPLSQYGAPEIQQQQQSQYSAPQRQQQTQNQYETSSDNKQQSLQNNYGAPEIKQQPQSQYGAPERQQPQSQYGAPQRQQQVQNEYGVPQRQQQVQNEYGVPQRQQQVQNEYGVPQRQQQVQNEYGVPERQQQVQNEYGVSQRQQHPQSQYGAPQSQQPQSQYGAPQSQQPQIQYGTPEKQQQQSQNQYGAPEPQQVQYIQPQPEKQGGTGYSGATQSVGVSRGYFSGSNNAEYSNSASKSNEFSGQSTGGGYSGGSNRLSDSSNGVGSNIHKFVYVHTAPDEPPTPSPVRQTKEYPKPDKHYQIIFVKTPEQNLQQQQEIELPPEPERKTLVYVLVKRPDENGPKIRIAGPAPTQPSKPEVYFIRYKDAKGGAKQEGQTADSISSSYGVPQGGLASSSAAQTSTVALPAPVSFHGTPRNAGNNNYAAHSNQHSVVSPTTVPFLRPSNFVDQQQQQQYKTNTATSTQQQQYKTNTGTAATASNIARSHYTAPGSLPFDAPSSMFNSNINTNTKNSQRQPQQNQYNSATSISSNHQFGNAKASMSLRY